MCVFCGTGWDRKIATVYRPNVNQVPAARRTHRMAVALAAIVMVGVGPLSMIFVGPMSPMAPLFFAIFYVYEVVVGVRLHRVSRSLREHRGTLCRFCAYPLDMSMSQCPECGRPGSAAEAREVWCCAGLWTPDEQTAKEMLRAARESQA